VVCSGAFGSGTTLQPRWGHWNFSLT